MKQLSAIKDVVVGFPDQLYRNSPWYNALILITVVSYVAGISYRLAPKAIVNSMKWWLGRCVLFTNLVLTATTMMITFDFKPWAPVICFLQSGVSLGYSLLYYLAPGLIYGPSMITHVKRRNQIILDLWDVLLHWTPFLYMWPYVMFQAELFKGASLSLEGLKKASQSFFSALTWVGAYLLFVTVHVYLFDRGPYNLASYLLSANDPSKRPSFARRFANLIQGTVQLADRFGNATYLLPWLEVPSFVIQRYIPPTCPPIDNSFSGILQTAPSLESPVIKEPVTKTSSGQAAGPLVAPIGWMGMVVTAILILN